MGDPITQDFNWKGARGMLWAVFGGIVIFALGGFIFLKTDIIWKITEQWKSYSADEPSDLYLISMKTGGVLFMLLGIAMAVLPFILGE